MNDLLRSSLALSEPTVEKMRAFLVLGFLCIWPVCLSYYTEDHREQFHYSQAKGWMNDPNGLIFYKGVYHMFYQHNPLNNTFGPIHWGHTITRDLVHWEEQQLAIFPDKLGYIFSGSAVIDYNNTAGFGTPGNPAMVAIFAQHNQPLEDQGLPAQTQGIAYSLDDGQTFTMYSGNPVVANPGIKDFRDPNVFWYEPEQKWVMILAVSDHMEFYSSKNLKNWMKMSEFGKDVGAHGGPGSWECPDLLKFDYQGITRWVLLVSINPGGPNNGSATQYFVGNFDGTAFTPMSVKIKWMDIGTDNYAGQVWANMPTERHVAIGWMSDWLYAILVPTNPWRGTDTIPRDLTLKTLNGEIYMVSKPVPELDVLLEHRTTLSGLRIQGQMDITPAVNQDVGRYRLIIQISYVADWSIVLSNSMSEQLTIGYRMSDNSYYIDRTQSRTGGIRNGYVAVQKGPRISMDQQMDVVLWIDVASIEMFADGGLTCMTAIFFPHETFSKLVMKSPGNINVAKLDIAQVKSIWTQHATGYY